jgi:protocatechuate 3,4-dioxygenase beta subunit
MKRIEFLKKAGFSLLSAEVMLAACQSSNASVTPNDTTTSGGDNNLNCNITQTETEGPFPTKSPDKFRRKDIRDGKTGVLLTVNYTIQNKNKSCAALEGAIVDVWHCDKDGNYSEYGSFGSVDFLRGRIISDAKGLASFTTVFPGWYPGRAPHIHFHVYNSAGKSLLISQNAFPKNVCDVVYGTATDFYTKGLQSTTNEKDGVFGGNVATLMPAIKGNNKEGYVLDLNIVVNA